jgi:hypothetical protein
LICLSKRHGVSIKYFIGCVPTPYRSDEIASALVEAAKARGLSFRELEVVADEKAQLWLIRLKGEGREHDRLTFPFASGRGIYTPAEIAGHLTAGTWPFSKFGDSSGA